MRKMGIFAFILLLATAGFCFQNSSGDKPPEDKKISKVNDPLKRVFLHIKFANKRIHLIKKKRAEGEPKELYPLIDEYRENIEKAYNELMIGQAQGHDMSSALNAVNRATSKHIVVLNRVLAKVPEQAKGAIRHAIEVSQRGRQTALENLSMQKNKQKELTKARRAGKGKALGKEKSKDHPGKGKKRKRKQKKHRL